MALPAEVFQALGDPIRLEIVRRLGEGGPTPTLRLVENLGITRQAATKHLVVLEAAGLVTGVKDGREVVRALRPEGFVETQRWLEERAVWWENKLGALKRLVESDPPKT